MEQNIKLHMVNRIVTGIFYLDIGGHIYKYSNPNKEQIALSNFIYQEALNEAKFNDLLTREALKTYLAKNNIWTPKDDAFLKDLYKLLDDLKIQLYDALFDQTKQKTVRRNIKSLETRIRKAAERQFTLDHMTLESYAENIKYKYLTCMSITDFDGSPVYTHKEFKGLKDVSIYSEFVSHIHDNIVQAGEFREIARTDPFRNLYSLSKEDIYKRDPIEWSSDQKTLLIYSKMYDNVYENPERPDDKVIEDDDMLDGWFAKNRREADQARKKKEANSIHSHNDGNGDLFIMSNSRESANEIANLNDIHNKMKMKQRDKAVQEKGRLETSQLPDVKQDLKQQAMRQQADRFKR